MTHAPFNDSSRPIMNISMLMPSSALGVMLWGG